MAETAKQTYMKRGAALKSARSSQDPVWRELAENILPRRSRFFTSETNQGQRKDQSIINNRPTVAARTLRALMMSGMSSPARRWFLGTVSDPALRQLDSVKDWCFAVESAIREALKKSNIYQCLDNVYGDLGTFAISALHVEEDLEAGIRGYVFPIGSYSLANNARLAVDTCFREVQMTVKEVVEKFGLEKCSAAVKTAYDTNNLNTPVDVTHVIEPNRDHQPGQIGPRGMKFRSCWYESATADENFLSEGGYEENPLMTPRWNVNGADVYGSGCPGMEAIGDAKVLQLLERRSMRAFHMVVDPPMAGPTSLIGQRASNLPGDFVPVESSNGVEYKPSVVINPAALQAFQAKIAEYERRIESTYYADLALMMQRLEGGRMTATEVNARQQEQMLLLGSVMERSEEELLRPLLYRVFMILWRQGRLPPPPPELHGVELKWDFVSIMAQAQKLIGTANIERMLSLVGNLVAVQPNAMDKIDTDQAIDEYGDALAVPPAIIRSDDEVASIRQAKAQQAQQVQQQQQLAAQVQGAQVLSKTDTSGDNALTRLLGNVTGQPAPGTPAGN